MKHLFTTLLVVLTSTLHAADLKLASVFADHMVLQREKPVAVWGWADPGESVTVSFCGQAKTSTAGADGHWSLKMDALQASAESQVFTVTGKDGRKIEVKDVLVGEVWLGSGQSNMAMTVAGCYRLEEEKAAAKFPLIRHYRESSGPADAPQAEGKGAWQICTPENVGGFSATLFFFGREIHREVGVPVGLINTSVGGTPIESWVAAEVQSSDPETKASYDTRLEAHRKFDPAQAPALHQKQIAIWKKASEKAKADGTPFVVPAPKDPLAMWKLKGGPAGLFNGKVVNLAACRTEIKAGGFASLAGVRAARGRLRAGSHGRPSWPLEASIPSILAFVWPFRGFPAAFTRFADRPPCGRGA